MELGTNEVILTARGQSSGVATETIDAVITGKTEDAVRFDPFRFTEGLTATNSPWVKLSFINKSKPVLLTAAKEAGKDIEDGYKYWLMPKLYN
jgi:DNA polymerase-3 subunit beta